MCTCKIVEGLRAPFYCECLFLSRATIAAPSQKRGLRAETPGDAEVAPCTVPGTMRAYAMVMPAIWQ